MFKWKNEKNIPCISGDRMPYLFLLAAGIIEFLFIALESQFSYLGYYLAEDYLIVPTLLFLGYALSRQLTGFTKRRLLLAGAAITWFVLVQLVHKLSGMETHPIATVFCVYLMAFPFASVSEDSRGTGVRWIGGLFLAASLVLVGYTVLMLLNRVPSIWADFLYWDGARLHVFWHPNISACFFMIGIGFAAAFLAQSEKLWVKALMAAAIAAQYVAMALTNCRTTLLLTGALFGGILFFLIFKGGWKRFILGLLAAVLALTVSFKGAGVMYQSNNDRIDAQIQAQKEAAALAAQEAAQAAAAPEQAANGSAELTETESPEPTEESKQLETPKTVVVWSPEGDTVLRGENGQGTLSNDMRTLNGRDEIWTAALSAVRDSKVLALFGTEYAGTVISAYNRFPVVHGHNSWIESLLRMGIPGLLISLVFTVLSAWSAAKLVLNSSVAFWKKILAMTAMCLMAAGFLEPYLFITNVYYHVTDFAFFFLAGYLDYWANGETNV